MSQFSGPVLVIPSALGSPANSGSMAANITSAPTFLANQAGCSFQVKWTGTSPVGTISVEGSNDANLNPGINPGTWDVLTVNYGGAAVTSIPISGNTGSGIIDITMTAISAIRIVYTRTSGTGTLTANQFSKVV